MLKSKILWAFVFGVLTAAFLLEAKINLGYSPLWSRILEVLSAPGTHLATSLNQPGVLLSGWQAFWTGLAFACNLVIYTFFWYACIWIVATARSRKQPYDHQDNTLMPPLTR